MNKGQSPLVIIISAAGVLLGAFGFYTNTNVRTDNKIGEVKIDQSQTQERVAKLEEAVATIKTDNAEIKADIKQILKLLK